MSKNRRLFAVVPAAGHSRRMGQAKLLLPLGGRTVIRRLLDVLDRPEITERIVVLRRDDDPLWSEVSDAEATIVRPETAPPDMRSSVEQALAEIRREQSPTPDDGWMLVPGDHPMLSTTVFDTLIEHWNRHECLILVPTCKARRGHPTFFRWKLVDEAAALPRDRGLNELLRVHHQEICELPIDDRAVLTDLDTPADYEALRSQREW